jgi:hypothetical protein
VDNIIIEMTTPNCERISDDLHDAIAKEILEPLCKGFQSRQRIYFVVDTANNDVDFLQDQVLTQIKTQLGEPYVVDYATIGSRSTLAQDLLAMVFLKSEFPATLLKKKQIEVHDKVFRILLEKREGSLLEIAQRFLECRSLNDRQRQKLGIDFDLSDMKNAVEFFKQCVGSYLKFFNKMPVFYFRNLKFDQDSLKSYTNIKFIKTVQKEVSCVFILKVPKNYDYLLLYVEDICAVIRLSTLDSANLNDIVSRICRSLRTKRKVDFTEEGLEEFSKLMRHIHGKTVSASALAKTLLDLEGHAMIKGEEQISAKIVRELLSPDTIKIKPPIPRQPKVGLSPYFANEVERLTRYCEVFGLDPHYSLPWNFRKVLKYISYGCLKYSHDDDAFQILRYIQHRYWLELDSSLRSMGYRYMGNGKWVFSPKQE